MIMPRPISTQRIPSANCRALNTGAVLPVEDMDEAKFGSSLLMSSSSCSRTFCSRSDSAIVFSFVFLTTRSRRYPQRVETHPVARTHSLVPSYRARREQRTIFSLSATYFTNHFGAISTRGCDGAGEPTSRPFLSTFAAAMVHRFSCPSIRHEPLPRSPPRPLPSGRRPSGRVAQPPRPA